MIAALWRAVRRFQFDRRRGFARALEPHQRAALSAFAAMYRQMDRMVEDKSTEELRDLLAAAEAVSPITGAWDEAGAASWILPRVRGILRRREINGRL